MSRPRRYVWNLRDDITYILQAREVLLTHPGRYFVPRLLNAAFCRLYIIAMVAYFEHIFEKWREEGHDKHGIIDQYLRVVKRKNSTLDERLEVLKSAFASADITIDPDVLADFLAIVRLRNAIVHSGMKEANASFVARQGFPTDPAELDERHFHKIHRTMQELLGYLERSGDIKPADEGWSFETASLLIRRFSEPDDRLKLVRTRDVPGMFWLNLERISAHIRPDINRVIRSEEYSWRNAVDPATLRNLSLSRDELRLQEYMAARRASEAGVSDLTQHRHLGAIALESWREYWRLTFEPLNLTPALLQGAVPILSDAFEGADFLNDSFSEAFSLARTVDRLTKNGSAAELFTWDMPVIDPDRTHEYLDEAERAISAFGLVGYYSALQNWQDEHRREEQERGMRQAQENIAFYRQAIDAFRAVATGEHSSQ